MNTLLRQEISLAHPRYAQSKCTTEDRSRSGRPHDFMPSVGVWKDDERDSLLRSWALPTTRLYLRTVGKPEVTWVTSSHLFDSGQIMSIRGPAFSS